MSTKRATKGMVLEARRTGRGKKERLVFKRVIDDGRRIEGRSVYEIGLGATVLFIGPGGTRFPLAQYLSGSCARYCSGGIFVLTTAQIFRFAECFLETGTRFQIR